MKEEEKEILGILYCVALILIVTLFDPEMGCAILGISIMLFMAMLIIRALS